jgi:general nucleoside transport system ATP-binding protein
VNALELQGIVKRFGPVTALDGVSLAMAPGEVLALVGENGAGKSTLVSVACGLYRADAGTVSAFGRQLPPGDPRGAIEAGIGVVYQHFMLVGPLTVWENAVLGREPSRFGFIDRRRSRSEVAEVARKLALAIDVDARVETLSVAAQQRVEILKQLWRGARALILDEPTALLSPQESLELMRTVRALAAEGRAVLFISHKLREVLAVADRIAVMRRGKVLSAAAPRSGTDTAALTGLVMGGAPAVAGRSLATRMPPRPEIALRARELTCSSDRGLPALRGVSFDVRRGEIVGVAGIDGNGQSELAEAIAGLRPAGGLLSLDGDTSFHRSPASARRAGVAHLPEDRRRLALCGPLSVEENLALGHHSSPPYARGFLIDRRGRRAMAERLIADFDVRTPDPTARAADLSGGNQQKLVAARELSGGLPPRLIVAVHPTRGLDPGASRRVHEAFFAAQRGGAAILVVSLDLDELRELCHRILVLFEGRVAGEAAPEATDEQLGRMMLGQVSAVA